MITLVVTEQQADEILFATSQLYLDYLDNMPADYDAATRRYNDTVDELRETLKQQISGQKK